jgi:predicted N-acetyltransferase YhbS
LLNKNSEPILGQGPAEISAGEITEQTIMVKIRSLTQQDLPAADRIFRLAFGTFLGVPEPEQFWADLAYARTRWPADPTAAFGAELDGELVGSNFATRWGSVGFFGPLTVRPDLWDRKIAQRLMDPIMERFDSWGVTHAGLFTFAQSPKHLGLYYKYGFRPRFLTAIMSKAVEPKRGTSGWTMYSQISESERKGCLEACRQVTESIYPGLDVEREIRATHTQGLGETLLINEGGDVVGFAVCHCGPGTEAGNQKCYVKFGAVQPGSTAGARFDQLLDACEELAAARGLARLEAGTSLARHEAYATMLERGFRTDNQGVTMHRPNEPGYSRAGVYVIDDWR